MDADFTFVSGWSLGGVGPGEVAEVVTDLASYPLWWPQVRAVARIDQDTARVLCRSTLPYTLNLVLQAVSRRPPELEVRLSGDLQGTARWRLAAVPGGTAMEFRQEVTVTGALAWASRVARPLLAWNHARMMTGCEAGLRSRLSAPRAAGR